MPEECKSSRTRRPGSRLPPHPANVARDGDPGFAWPLPLVVGFEAGAERRQRQPEFESLMARAVLLQIVEKGALLVDGSDDLSEGGLLSLR